ncbi:hypothetical protein BU16DRAFT_557666 [Lophium mytilinum]|uniref:Uncharacterized protein n=1 Tax=Lophium mytilinum TaxID=390894 RepID=A0A6A6R3I8_9PEZI|nr:hypothetical protein BU16DRAFT_557666 [Lophium mytilinum]
MAITKHTITTANATHRVLVTHNKTIDLICTPPAVVHAEETYCFCAQDHYDRTMTVRCQGPNGKNKGCPFGGWFHKEHAKEYEHKLLGTLRAYGIRCIDNMSFCSACRGAYNAKTQELRETGLDVQRYRRCLGRAGVKEWDVGGVKEDEGCDGSSEGDSKGYAKWYSKRYSEEGSEETMDSEGTMEGER